ncbi:hypothetical protein [Pandoravirus japonicus]|uniref:Uncharacterized protein n=1 Tax=Pandoravirus japonicus TaxID=2823154 RepID=A0A811BQB8_9VIRU|nr:hypothetical protein [Pandoravirus japonicus]
MCQKKKKAFGLRAPLRSAEPEVPVFLFREKKRVVSLDERVHWRIERALLSLSSFIFCWSIFLCQVPPAAWRWRCRIDALVLAVRAPICSISQGKRVINPVGRSQGAHPSRDAQAALACALAAQ